MSAGVASLSTNPRTVPGSSGPPFPINSAHNGVSVDAGGFLVLGNIVGGNSAALLNNREIPMAGFSFEMLSALKGQFLLDPTNFDYRIGDYDGAVSGSALRINAIVSQSLLGDVLNTVNGTKLVIDDAFQTIRMHAAGGNPVFFNADIANGLFEYGDVFPVNNGNELQIDDTNNITRLGDVQSITNALILELDNTNAVNAVSLGDIHGVTNGQMLLIDNANQAVVLGDVNGVAGQSIIFLDLTNFEVDCGAQTQIISYDNANSITRLSTGMNAPRSAIFLKGPTSAQPLTMELIATNGIFTTADGFLIHSLVSYTDGAAASVGTLTNAPAAGNPTKWIPIDDNGTTRFIPAW